MAKIAKNVSRRSFVALVTGAAAATVVAAPALAKQRTDSDPSDAANRSGLTDSDTGSSADVAGNGRGNSGVSDSDSGANGDCAGRGRGSTTGQSDSDSGSSADQGGNGRTGVSDNDPTDRSGYGRGRGTCPA